MRAHHTTTLITACAVGLTACSKKSGPTQEELDTPPPTIEHMLIEIGTFDPETMTAGDITFRGGETFIPFGKLIEGTNGLKRTPELTFFVTEGTPVKAPITGTVSQIDVLYSDDYLIILRQDDNPWEVGVEHVVDPQVQVGDRVVAGQTIATATPEDTPFGIIAFTELAVWIPADRDDLMLKKCPYLSFSSALKTSYSSALYALTEAWETHWGEDVFDTDAWTQPGCLIDELTEAEADNPTG